MGFKPTPEFFEMAQVLFLVLLVAVVMRFFRGHRSQSRFRPASEQKTRERPTQPSREKVRVLLQGVVLSGLPHQILNVRQDASEFEIRKAHRTLIKRVHPDKMGPEGSREWYEGQRASEIINTARDEMLKKLKERMESGQS